MGKRPFKVTLRLQRITSQIDLTAGTRANLNKTAVHNVQWLLSVVAFQKGVPEIKWGQVYG